MDRSFDLVALLRQQPTTKSHKIRPTQFLSVANGVQKRLETNIKNRKSSRLTVFDRIRNIPRCESPKAPVISDVQQKAMHRKQQLEKWKEEKEKKKKEAAALKKKPFVTGVSQRKSFGPPPPAKPVPSTSGRVTRSQTRLKQSKPSNTQTKSFAPSNASFKPPQFLNSKVPTLAQVNKKKTNKPNPTITFEPVLPKILQKVEPRSTRARPVTNKTLTVDSKTRKPNDKPKAKAMVLSQKSPPLKQHMFQSSSSSSDMEQKSILRTKPTQRKSITRLRASPVKQNVFQSSSSSDMEGKTSISKASQRKSTSKAQEISSMSQDSSQDSVSVSSQDAISMSSQDAISVSPQDAISMSSQDAISVSPQDAISTSSQDAISVSPQDAISTSSLDAISVSPQDAISTSSLNAISVLSQESLSTPRTKVPKSESSSEEKLRSPKGIETQLTPEQIIEEAKNISPCVTLSRGKNNARKEMKKKLDEGLLDEDNSNIDSINHFRRQLNSEIARMTAMCETWDLIRAQTVLPEPVQELVLTAVGQSRLLMSQKLQQFSSLVDRCEKPSTTTGLVTPADLHGFWDMVFMQIENVDMRFKKLEELRLANWIDEKKPEAKKVAKPVAKKVAAKPTGGPSRLREMIAAARKAKKQETQSDTSGSETSEACPEVKTFEAGFFSVSSPLKRSPAPGTPVNKCTLLKSVLSSEARKSVAKNSTSFAMLRASLMSKNVDIEGVSPLLQTPTITPVNLYATPARSILKQNNPISCKKTDKLKTVLFHESDAEVPSSPVSYASCNKSPDQSVTGVVPLDKEVLEDKEAEEKENKPTPRRRSRLSRQNAVDLPSPVTSPRGVMTRSRRKSAHTPLVEPDNNVNTKKRSNRKPKDAPEIEAAVDNKKRFSRKTEDTPEIEAPVDTKKRFSRKTEDTPEIEAPVDTKKRFSRKTEDTPEIEAPVDTKKRFSRKTEDTPEMEAPVDTKKRFSRKTEDTPEIEAAVDTKKRFSRKTEDTPEIEAPVDNKKRFSRKTEVTPEIEAAVDTKKRFSRKAKDTPEIETPVETKKRPSRKTLDNLESETPKRSTRRRKSAIAV